VSDKIFTPKEAAKCLKVASETVIELLESGDLPGRQIGGEWRTTRRAIMSFVDGVPLQQTVCCTPTVCCTEGDQTTDGTTRCC
jgi:excisionase family DNA binding protein